MESFCRLKILVGNDHSHTSDRVGVMPEKLRGVFVEHVRFDSFGSKKRAEKIGVLTL